MTDERLATPDTHRESLDSNLNELPEIVARIVETMRRAKLDSIVLKKGDFHLEMRSMATPPDAGNPVRPAAGADTEEVPPQEENVHIITSPMIGTFYVAPAPGEPPFVQPGDSVVPDQVIGIVEAMKVMNEIAADRAGTVIDIVAENAETVEYGSPLIRLQIQT